VGVTLRSLVLLAFLVALAVPTGLLPIIPALGSSDEMAAQSETPGPALIPLGGSTPTATVMPVTPTPHVPRVGIIS